MFVIEGELWNLWS